MFIEVIPNISLEPAPFMRISSYETFVKSSVSILILPFSSRSVPLIREVYPA